MPPMPDPLKLIADLAGIVANLGIQNTALDGAIKAAIIRLSKAEDRLTLIEKNWE